MPERIENVETHLGRIEARRVGDDRVGVGPRGPDLFECRSGSTPERNGGGFEDHRAQIEDGCREGLESRRRWDPLEPGFIPGHTSFPAPEGDDIEPKIIDPIAPILTDDCLRQFTRRHRLGRRDRELADERHALGSKCGDQLDVGGLGS